MALVGYLLFVVAALAALAPGATSAAAVEPMTGVTTDRPVAVTGLVSAESKSGAVLVTDHGGVAEAQLTAEVVVIELGWEKGVDARNGGSIAHVVQDRGSEHVRLEQVDVRFDPFRSDPVLLAHAETSSARFTVETAEGLTFSWERDVRLVTCGTSPDAMDGMEAPDLGYWYTAEGPVVAARGGGGFSVSGSFTLFVHEVVIHAEGSGKSWSDWTGYRESRQDAPVAQYEFRVTTIKVVNGTLRGFAADDLGLYVPSLEARVEGAVTSHDVSGRLLTGSELHIFDQDRLRLEGKGHLDVRPGRSAAAGSEGGSNSGLWVAPTGAFDIMGASVVTASRATGLGPLGPSWLWPPLGGTAALAVVALMVLGVVPGPTPASRRRRYARRMQEGRRAEIREDWKRAARCYRGAARLRKDDPLAAFNWAAAELSGGDPKTAESVARRVAPLAGVDPADILELRAVAAWERGDVEAFAAFLISLAQVSPGMATGLLGDLGPDASAYSTTVARLLDDRRLAEGQDGYA